MNRMALALAGLVMATSASAGVRVETVTRDIKTRTNEGAPQVVQIQGSNARVDVGDNGALILRGDKVVILDDQRKTFREMDKATMRSTMDLAGSVMTQMLARMKDLSPEQRSQMEKMLGPNVTGLADGGANVFNAVDTGRNETVEGRNCRVWNINRNERIHSELCVVQFATLPGHEYAEVLFDEIAGYLQSLASALPGAAGISDTVNAVKGYPVRVRPYDDAGVPSGTESVLSSWTEQEIPAASFEAPSGYTRQEMPQLGF